MKKNIFLFLTTLISFAISSSRESEIAALQKAIKECHIKGLAGHYNSKICELRSKFLKPDLTGELKDSENFFVLHGKTGNGKTSIAQNMADECNAKLFEIENALDLAYIKKLCSEIERYTNVGKKAVFLLDEIDSIRNSEICEYLHNFFKQNRNNRNLLVIGTSNYITALNGQIKDCFGNTIFVDLPDLQTRKDILIYCSSPNNYAKLSDEFIEQISKDTNGLSRRALKNIVSGLIQQFLLSGTITEADTKNLIQKEQIAEQIYKEDWKKRLARSAGKSVEDLLSAAGWLVGQYIKYKLENPEPKK